MVKAVLLDFDGTLVYKDILDVVCGIVGKEEESARINHEFHAGKRTGLAPLIERINFLQGVSLSQIREKLDEGSYLIPGAKELLEFLNARGIVSILNSGNILPVLEYYKKLLGITYLVGTKPKMEGEIIRGIAEGDFLGRDFKLLGVKQILGDLHIGSEAVVAIGDSPADKSIFDFAGKAIAINPKEGIEVFADFVVKDLHEAKKVIEMLL
jgi:phosphoserine phosphatase